jgi:hypothetical protein
MKTPFGNTGAAVKLAEMVETDPRTRRYVSSTLSELGATLREILVVDSKQIKRLLYRLVREQYVTKVDESKKLPPAVATFLKNVIVAKCRSFQKYVEKA